MSVLVCLATCVSLGGAQGAKGYAFACIPSANSSVQPDRSAITRIIESYVRRHSEDLGRFEVTNLDVQGAWALAEITPREQQTDPARVLLRRQRRGWRVLVMGTGLYGTGRTYGVPRPLRKKWGL